MQYLEKLHDIKYYELHGYSDLHLKAIYGVDGAKKELEEKLEEAKGRYSIPLAEEAVAGHFKTVELMLKNGVSINEADKELLFEVLKKLANHRYSEFKDKEGYDWKEENIRIEKRWKDFRMQQVYLKEECLELERLEEVRLKEFYLQQAYLKKAGLEEQRLQEERCEDLYLYEVWLRKERLKAGYLEKKQRREEDRDEIFLEEKDGKQERLEGFLKNDGLIRVIDLLIDNGANTSAVGTNGELWSCPLIEATKAKSTHIVNKLITHDAEINGTAQEYKEGDEIIALTVATKKKNFPIALAVSLIEGDSDILHGALYDTTTIWDKTQEWPKQVQNKPLFQKQNKATQELVEKMLEIQQKEIQEKAVALRHKIEKAVDVVEDIHAYERVTNKWSTEKLKEVLSLIKKGSLSSAMILRYEDYFSTIECQEKTGEIIDFTKKLIDKYLVDNPDSSSSDTEQSKNGETKTTLSATPQVQLSQDLPQDQLDVYLSGFSLDHSEYGPWYPE